MGKQEYVSAHESFKSLIVTGKVVTALAGKFKVADAAPKQGMINATIEVIEEEESPPSLSFAFMDFRFQKWRSKQYFFHFFVCYTRCFSI